MEPQLVISIDPTREDVGPWPRLTRILALVTLIYALCNFVDGAMSLYYNFLHPPPSMTARYVSVWDNLQAKMAMLAISRGLVSSFTAAAAFYLWKTGRGHRLLISRIGL